MHKVSHGQMRQSILTQIITATPAMSSIKYAAMKNRLFFEQIKFTSLAKTMRNIYTVRKFVKMALCQ